MLKKHIRIFFEKAGLETTVQDLGRSDYLAYGVPQSGAMDKFAYRIANHLLDNPINTPVLEITYLAPNILIEGDCQIALTGANLSPKLNGKTLPMYEAVNIQESAKLSFGNIQNGCRTYLAIRGNWLLEQHLGSCSTLNNSKLGKAIQKGDELFVEPFARIPKRIFPKKFRPTYPEEVNIRVLPAPEFEDFDKQSIGFFFSQTYTISKESNRIGYRLQEVLPNFSPQTELISSATLPGTIQITSAGQAIVLLADAQTTGGYPRIAQVITADLDKFAQLKPNDKIRFQLVTWEEARRILSKKMSVLAFNLA